MIFPANYINLHLFWGFSMAMLVITRWYIIPPPYHRLDTHSPMSLPKWSKLNDLPSGKLTCWPWKSPFYRGNSSSNPDDCQGPTVNLLEGKCGTLENTKNDQFSLILRVTLNVTKLRHEVSVLQPRRKEVPVEASENGAPHV